MGFIREMPGSDLHSKYSKVSSPALAKAGWVEDYNLSADEVRNLHILRSFVHWSGIWC